MEICPSNDSFPIIHSPRLSMFLEFDRCAGKLSKPTHYSPFFILINYKKVLYVENWYLLYESRSLPPPWSLPLYDLSPWRSPRTQWTLLMRFIRPHWSPLYWRTRLLRSFQSEPVPNASMPLFYQLFCFHLYRRFGILPLQFTLVPKSAPTENVIWD